MSQFTLYSHAGEFQESTQKGIPSLARFFVRSSDILISLSLSTGPGPNPLKIAILLEKLGLSYDVKALHFGDDAKTGGK